MLFPTNYQDILLRIENIDPLKYGQTRNYLNGAVTYLSPYISRGLISTRQVADIVLAKGYPAEKIESLLKELAWRDYFQQVWIEKGDSIDNDLKQLQLNVTNKQIPDAIINARTGIHAVDTGIVQLQETGYMHNHMRMYVASIACNIGNSHWYLPAKWMYYYLLDADWASNALSWQWVAGSFSSKKYYANQENINKYCNSNQQGTFLDRTYDEFETMTTPDVLLDCSGFAQETKLPACAPLNINVQLPTYVYNFYNLDCEWDSKVEANRILLLEPDFFRKYPVCNQTISFVLELAKNIQNIQVYVGAFADLESVCFLSEIHYKEHPTTSHYRGLQHKRKWMFESVTGYFPSFFAYWKKCEKYLK
jgi:deoxyribodipyrimidine photo-lyase